MTDWVRMKHPGTGGTTLVTERSVKNYERRGWVLGDSTPEPLPSEPAPDVRPKPVRGKNEKVTQDPAPNESGSDNEKEDG